MPDLTLKVGNLEPEHLDEALTSLVPGIGGRFMPNATQTTPVTPTAASQANFAHQPIALFSSTPAIPRLVSLRSIFPDLPATVGAGDDALRLAPSPITPKTFTRALPALPDDRIPRMTSSDAATTRQPALPEIPLIADEPPDKLGEPGKVHRALSVLGKIGKDASEVAGQAFVPTLMPWIPGTPQHEWMLEREQQATQDEQARRAYEASETQRNLAEANRPPETRLQSLEVAGSPCSPTSIQAQENTSTQRGRKSRVSDPTTSPRRREPTGFSE